MAAKKKPPARKKPAGKVVGGVRAYRWVKVAVKKKATRKR